MRLAQSERSDFRHVVVMFLTVLIIAIFGHPQVTHATPAVNGPKTCDVEPLTTDELTTLAGAIAVEPAAIDASELTPVDAETLAKVEATVLRSVACTNANQPLSTLALFTPRYLTARFGGDGADELGHLLAALTRDPGPAAPNDRLTFIEIRDAETDGFNAVVATVVVRNAATVFTDRLVFVEMGEEWRIDQVLSIDPPATPVSTTP